MSNVHLDFSSVDWGPDEARNDPRLPSYFVEIPGYEDVLAGRKRYVIGRKGTGKTAVLERIRREAQESPRLKASSMSLRSFPLPHVRDLRDKSLRDKSQFVPVWAFLIAVEFAKLVVQANDASPKDIVGEIREFLRNNELADGAGIAETLSTLRSRGGKVSAAAGWLGMEISVGREDSVGGHVHYERVTEALLIRLARVTTDATYFVLMDELDEGFKAGDAGLRLLLLSLLRASEDVALRLRSAKTGFRPVVALRSDIFDSLEDNDLNKLDDFLLRIKWSSLPDPERVFALRTVVEARIAASVHAPRASVGWESVVLDTPRDLPRQVRSVWSFMMNRTFERPRDIIKFLKYARELKPPVGRLPFPTVREAELGYSGWLYREVRDEMSAFLPVWRESLQCLTRVGRGRFPVRQLLDSLTADRAVKEWLSSNNLPPEAVVETLFNYGVIGNISTRDVWLFKYKDDDLAWNPGMDVIVHFGIGRKLKVLRDQPEEHDSLSP